jgi:hypothetical protein
MATEISNQFLKIGIDNFGKKFIENLKLNLQNTPHYRTGNLYNLMSYNINDTGVGFDLEIFALHYLQYLNVGKGKFPPAPSIIDGVTQQTMNENTDLILEAYSKDVLASIDYIFSDFK